MNAKAKKELIGFDDRWMIIFGVPIVSMMVNAMLLGRYSLQSLSHFFGSCFLLSICYTGAFWLIIREVHFRSLAKYSGRAEVPKRLIITGIASLLAFIIVDFTLKNSLHSFYPEENAPGFLVEMLTTFVFISLIVGIYEAMYFSNMFKKATVERERLIKENVHSQLEGLRSQVNPHFLFNSLNTLASIIPEDPEKGVDFVTNLAKVYRYMLESRNENLIALREELEFLNAYLYLIKQRFGDNLHFDIKLEEGLKDKLIIPLSLQITFENAIKHNIISKEKPLLIEVQSDGNGKLEVKNKLQKKRTIGASTKLGLQNIKNRYAFYTDSSVDVIATEQYFSVLLPLLSTNQIPKANA